MPVTTKLHYLPGHVVGKWTVLEETGRRGSHGYKRYYKCRCLCGEEHEVALSTLRYAKVVGGCRSCMKKRPHKYPPVGVLYGWYWRHVVASAKARGFSLDVTMEQMSDLFVKQGKRCALSGVPLLLSTTEGRGEGTTASLDRIDSTLGYTLGNVQWVHKDINIMKNVFSEEYFVSMCKLVAENLADSSAGSLAD